MYARPGVSLSYNNYHPPLHTAPRWKLGHRGRVSGVCRPSAYGLAAARRVLTTHRLAEHLQALAVQPLAEPVQRLGARVVLLAREGAEPGAAGGSVVGYLGEAGHPSGDLWCRSLLMDWTETTQCLVGAR